MTSANDIIRHFASIWHFVLVLSLIVYTCVCMRVCVSLNFVTLCVVFYGYDCSTIFNTFYYEILRPG